MTTVHIKPSSLATPLCFTSSHPPSIHRSWPIGMLKRIAALSSTRRTTTEAMHVFHHWLTTCCPHHIALRDVADHLANFTTRHGNSSRPMRCSSISWLVLPFKYQWTRAGLIPFLKLQSAKLRRLAAEEGWQCMPSDIRISWSLGHNNLRQIL